MRKLTMVLVAFGLVGCASNPNKAERINTVITHDEYVTGGDHLGIKNGDMIVQHKVHMAEELRDLQIGVYQLEDFVYGNDATGSRGQYGVLKDCRQALAQKENGGDGHLSWLEPVDRVTTHEEEMRIGLDEKDRLVGVTEEYLKDRIVRFQGYKQTLEKRKIDLQLKQDICTTDLKSRHFDQQASNH